MTGRVLAHVRRHLLRGLMLILPLVVTIWLLGLLFSAINDLVSPPLRWALERGGLATEDWFHRFAVPFMSVLLTVFFVYGLGWISSNLIGRRLVGWIESYILRVPVVRGIYGSARQLLHAFRATTQRTFSQVVMMEYPRKGMWAIGFVTNDSPHEIPQVEGGSLATLPVFLPTTPNPTSGWMILVPTRDLLVLDLTVEEAIKLIVSGGIVSPHNLGHLVRR